MTQGDVSRLDKSERVAIRCRATTKKEFKRICGYFKDSEAALVYLMNNFDPDVLRLGKGDLL
jgi:hypothetical protein